MAASRKHQKLARELSAREGMSYQAALNRVRNGEGAGVETPAWRQALAKYPGEAVGILLSEALAAAFDGYAGECDAEGRSEDADGNREVAARVRELMKGGASRADATVTESHVWVVPVPGGTFAAVWDAEDDSGVEVACPALGAEPVAMPLGALDAEPVPFPPVKLGEGDCWSFTDLEASCRALGEPLPGREQPLQRPDGVPGAGEIAQEVLDEGLTAAALERAEQAGIQITVRMIEDARGSGAGE